MSRRCPIYQYNVHLEHTSCIIMKPYLFMYYLLQRIIRNTEGDKRYFHSYFVFLIIILSLDSRLDWALDASNTLSVFLLLFLSFRFILFSCLFGSHCDSQLTMWTPSESKFQKFQNLENSMSMWNVNETEVKSLRLWNVP